jgi:hypothetical protein
MSRSRARLAFGSARHRVVAAVVAGALGTGCVFFRQSKELVKVIAHGESRRLRDEHGPRSALTEQRPDLLIIAIDGIDRDLLYGMLRRGELPGLQRFLGPRRGGEFLHAHLDDSVLSVLPSSTIPAWTSLFTGVSPARHGVAGNEFFVRERRALAAPVPVSFADATPVLESYTEDYADDLVRVPTIYQQIRERDPGVRIWVSMSQLHQGADWLLMARRTVAASAFKLFLEGLLSGQSDQHQMEVYGTLDGELIEVVGERLDRLEQGEPAPDVLTVYLAGGDLFAHTAQMGPDRARRAYLRDVLDAKLAALHGSLSRRGALQDRFVIVVSDHGHTQVLHDDRHALGSGDDGEPPDVLRAAGFRVRPFEWKVPDDHDYQAVIAYGGATAFVYLADRSGCAKSGQVCDFRRPPRFDEDVLPVAEAFYRSSRDGAPVAQMQGTIDLVLTRRPLRFGEEDRPFQVYVGDGRLEDVASHLARHPRAGYVLVDERLRDLGAGRLGERAGDILLIARDGAERNIADRYYFSATYQSWHGSPSSKDSQVPFILAHPQRTRAELRALVRRLPGRSPRLHHVGCLLVDLRLGTERRIGSQTHRSGLAGRSSWCPSR